MKSSFHERASKVRLVDLRIPLRARRAHVVDLLTKVGNRAPQHDASVFQHSSATGVVIRIHWLALVPQQFAFGCFRGSAPRSIGFAESQHLAMRAVANIESFTGMPPPEFDGIRADRHRDRLQRLGCLDSSRFAADRQRHIFLHRQPRDDFQLSAVAADVEWRSEVHRRRAVRTQSIAAADQQRRRMRIPVTHDAPRSGDLHRRVEASGFAFCAGPQRRVLRHDLDLRRRRGRKQPYAQVLAMRRNAGEKQNE